MQFLLNTLYQSGLWLVGLALLFYFEIFWPGILILLGMSALVGALTRPMMDKTPNGEQPEKAEK